MKKRDEQTYKSIISNLIDGMSCAECPYREDCSIDDYLDSDDIVQNL